MLSSLPRFPTDPTRRLTHALMLALTIAACLVTYLLKPDAGWNRILTIGLGYIGLALLALTLILGAWNLLQIKQHRNPVNVNLRRDTGIWGGLTGTAHALLGFTVHRGGDIVQYFFRRTHDGLQPLTDVFGFSNYTGAAAAVILILLLLLSNDLSVRLLRGPLWKWLQRLNYVLIILVLAHTFGYQLAVRRETVMAMLVVGLTALILIGQSVGMMIAFARGASKSPAVSPARAVIVVTVAAALVACSVAFNIAPFLLARSGGVPAVPQHQQTSVPHDTPVPHNPPHATPAHATPPAHSTP